MNWGWGAPFGIAYIRGPHMSEPCILPDLSDSIRTTNACTSKENGTKKKRVLPSQMESFGNT